MTQQIIIGRDQQTRKLCVITGGNAKLCGQPGSVPMGVSRQHLSLKPVGSGKWTVRNLNERNVTFVNGVAVESKTVSEQDKIELGNSRYLFAWDILHEPKGENIIGRKGSTSKATVQIDTTDRYMSRQHGSITITTLPDGSTKAVLSNYQNKNLTTIDGQPIETGDAIRLTDGDSIQMGHTIVIFKLS